MTARYLPPSVNGFCLVVTRPLASWYVVPTWRAPFFVLSFDQCDDETPEKPMLYHAETEECARSVVKYCGKLLTADFQEVRQ